jgi:ubiquinone/menaquinone biosynthesis C-methylase UbiE
MDTSEKALKIKEAVKTNFNLSSEQYQFFEDRYGFFRQLNQILISSMHIPADADILDVGCGTGAGTAQILEDLHNCKVWGLDNSPAMLETARSKFPESERIRFVEGDAAKLADYFDFSFDAIIYGASIFLIPDYKESLGCADRLLKENGSVGVSFSNGIYDSDENNLLAVADKSAGLGLSLKKPVVLSEFKSYFTRIFPHHDVWNHDFSFPVAFLREFFSVQAMSAGLFPALPYSDRLKKIEILFDHFPPVQPLFRWTLMVGRHE